MRDLSISDRLNEVNNKIKFDRLFDELMLIHKGNNSLMVYNTYKLCKYCQKNDEPYILLHEKGSLFLYYILGVINNNPIDYQIIYEPYLGTFYNPKENDYVYIDVRPSFKTKIEKYCIQLFKQFNYAYIRNYDNGFGDYHLSFIDDETDPIKREKEYFVNFSSVYTSKLVILKQLPNDKRIYVPNSITNEMVTDYSKELAVIESSFEYLSPIYDKDTFFGRYKYLGIEFDLHLMNKVRTGSLEKEKNLKDIFIEKEYIDLTKILYLPSRAESAQLAEIKYLIIGDR